MTRKWDWRMGVAWAGGMVGQSLWLVATPDPNPWIRIPAAILAALIMVPLVALIFSEHQP